MAAKRFLPVRRLLIALAAVYATVVLLAVCLGPSLRFAAVRLPGYLKGVIMAPEHRLWEDEAEELLEANRDLDRAKDLLLRAWAVEPNASTQFLLGEVLRAQGKRAEALPRYRASIELDPARAEPYLRAAEMLQDTGDAAAADRVLEEGAASLETALRLEAPVPDGTVKEAYNEKAREIHEELAENLEELRDAARGR